MTPPVSGGFGSFRPGVSKALSRRPVICTASAAFAFAAYGPCWFTLGWILLACGLLGFPTPVGSRLPAALLLGLSALLGPGPAAWAVMTAAALLLAVEGGSSLSRLTPAAVIPAALLDGGVLMLEAAAAAAVLAAVLPRRSLRRIVAFGGVLAGVLVLGPPSPSVRVPVFPEHMAYRFPLFDWHDPAAVDLGCPEVAFVPPGAPSAPVFVSMQAELPSDGSITALIRMGDDVQEVGDGESLFRLDGGSERLELSLNGTWRPFPTARVTITRIGGVTP
jgi:hypothetical protein